MIVLGSYNLDVEEMTLSRNGTVVVLEPKVLEVLLYLYENNDNYISMEELHENVWQGRVVSDAAVRRTISKLRLLFNDDHKVPRYIKSMPKRGYKLICPVSVNKPERAGTEVRSGAETIPADTPAGQSRASEEKPASEAANGGDGQAQEVNTSAGNSSGKGKFTWLFNVIIILLFVASVVERIVDHRGGTSGKIEVTTEVIEALPGDKLAVAQSPNGEYLAFAGQLSEHSGHQIYIKRGSSQDFVPLTQRAYFPIAIAFSSDSQALFYADMKEGVSSLNQVVIDNSGTDRVKILLENYHIIGDVFTSGDADLVYFSGIKKVGEPSYIYQYNLATAEVVRVTSSTQKYHLDIKGAVSPDGRLMAVLRYSEFEKVNEIRVINLTNDEVVYRRQQDEMVYDLHWLDNGNLLFLDEDNLVKVDYQTETEVEVLGKNHRLSSIAVVDEQHLFAISLPSLAAKKLFIEHSLPFSDWTTRQIFNVDRNIYYMGYHASGDSKLVVLDQDDVTSLAKLNTDNNEITPYIETEYELKPIASSSSGLLELIKINHRFVLFNTETNALSYITSGDDFVGDATFLTDETAILFSVKGYDQWEIHRYDIDTAKISKLLTGFRYIRPYGDNFILATDKGELFWRDAVSGEQVALNYALSLNPNTHWDVKGNFIYWSDHDVVRTVFHQLDISDVTKTVKAERSFDYNKVRPSFYLNQDGSSLLYAQRQQNSASILSLVLDRP